MYFFCSLLTCQLYIRQTVCILIIDFVAGGSAAASYSASRCPGSLPLPSIALQTRSRMSNMPKDPTSLQCDGGQRARPGAVGLHCACRGRAPPSRHIRIDPPIFITLSLSFTILSLHYYQCHLCSIQALHFTQGEHKFEIADFCYLLFPICISIGSP